MNNNPFQCQPVGGESVYNWDQLLLHPLHTHGTDCTDRLYTTLCLAIEQYSNYTIGIASNNTDNDIRRRLATLQRTELQQGIRLSSLLPNTTSILLHAVDILHLSILLSTHLAQYENDKYTKKAIDYITLEHCDQLYRLANLIDSETDIDMCALVNNLTEIMPTRPMIAEHLHPHDTIKRFCNYKQCNTSTIIHITLLDALSMYAQHYFATLLPHYDSTIGRRLLAELAHISSQHNTIYHSLADVNSTPLEKLLIAQYTECYCYYSAFANNQQHIYQHHYDQELYHLHSVANIIQHNSGKVWQQILGNAQYPEPITLTDSTAYIRKLITSTTNTTSQLEDYCDSATLDCNSTHAHYQQQLNSNTRHVPSHRVVSRHIADQGSDYRYMRAIHPIEQLEDRQHDNTTIGRII